MTLFAPYSYTRPPRPEPRVLPEARTRRSRTLLSWVAVAGLVTYSGGIGIALDAWLR